MRLTRRDAVATVLVAAIVVPYIGYLVRGSMPFIQDSRGMAGVGLVGLVLSFLAWGIGTGSLAGKALLVGGLVSIGLGFAALAIGVEGSEVLLAAFIASIVVVWVAETLFHGRVPRHSPQPAR